MRRRSTMCSIEPPQALLEVEYEATADDYLGDYDEQWALAPEPMPQKEPAEQRSL